MNVPVINFKTSITNDDNIKHWTKYSAQAWLGSGIRDKFNAEIFDGDIIQIDWDAAAKLIGEGILIHELRIAQPAPDGLLVVEFRDARFHVVWRTRNGAVDTGVDLYHIDAIARFVTVVNHISEVRKDETQYQTKTA